MEDRNSNIPEGFTLSLAIVDAVPVVEFCVSMLMIASKFRSIVFMAGAVLSTLAGCGKVVWKMLLACRRKNIILLNRQFRYLMGAGFLLMLCSIFVNRGRISPALLWRCITGLPSVIFFAAGFLGLAAMGVMAVRLDRNIARNNWIEQFVNIFAQGMILIGIALV